MLKEQYLKYQALEKELENLNGEKRAVVATLEAINGDIKVPGISLSLFEMEKETTTNSLHALSDRVKNNYIISLSEKARKRLLYFYLELLSEIEKRIKLVENQMLDL